MIDKIKLINFKCFKDVEIECNPGRNIFVGENGVGKSSILQAISMVLSGSISRIEKTGIENLFNVEATKEFLVIPREERKAEDLPELYVEIYFSKDTDLKLISKEPYKLNGKHNSTSTTTNGLRFIAVPNIENFSEEIRETLENSDVFPFDYYKPVFETFDGTSYIGYTKPFRIQAPFIDTTAINTTLTLKNQISRIFENQADKAKRQTISHEFHKITNDFSRKLYDTYGLNSNEADYKIKIKSSTESSFHEMITAQDDNEISIESFGAGEKVLLGVESSLAKVDDGKCQIVLIEEPENHLSYLNMHKLVEMVDSTETKQTFIATHSNMIASRLNLKNVILMSNFGKPLKLSDIASETANFFARAPNSNILDFILAKKAILVEGAAEYILMNEFYKRKIGHEPHKDDVTIISCNGKTFGRYLEIAQPLNKTVSVVTDNDKEFAKNITQKYKDYADAKNIKVFADEDNENHTFEVCLFNENEEFFAKNPITQSKNTDTQNYMLNNKAEAAFRLLNLLQDENVTKNFTTPKYIEDAIEWVNLKN